MAANWASAGIRVPRLDALDLQASVPWELVVIVGKTLAPRRAKIPPLLGVSRGDFGPSRREVKSRFCYPRILS